MNIENLIAGINLDGCKVAVLATNGFEQSELLEPVQALENAGAIVQIIAPAGKTIRAWQKSNWGETIDVHCLLMDANPSDYDAMLLPGGVINSDSLRMEQEAVAMVREFCQAGKPIAAICHGPQLLIEADVLDGKTLTSWPSLKTDLKNAGAYWIDQEVVTDNGLVTSRKPEDLPSFIKKMLEEFAEGPHTPHLGTTSGIQIEKSSNLHH